MKFDGKRILSELLSALFAFVFLGGGTFFLYLMGSFGMFPLYVTRVIPFVGVALLVAVIAAMSEYVSRKWTRRIWCLFAAVSLCCALYAGHGYYEDSIPTVEADDRMALLYNYIPFEEESKVATLEEEATLRISTRRDNLKLDGATALYPVYAAFVQATYPERVTEREYYPWDNYYVQCNGTIEAYERLIGGDVDVIFCAGPSQAQQKAAEEAGLALHLTPIGREAFVFFVNSKNPVTSLTVEQIQGIYSGEISNWKEVGGKNQSIRPFQRAADSGSQTALEQLMAGRTLMEPEQRDRIGGMGGIIREVASYRNHNNAIGYSFRFYASEMEAEDEIRLLALNGIAPTKETIRDGSYPIASEFYAVTASRIGEAPPQETNERLAAFLDWILSEQGQELVEKTGYVSLEG